MTKYTVLIDDNLRRQLGVRMLDVKEGHGWKSRQSDLIRGLLRLACEDDDLLARAMERANA